MFPSFLVSLKILMRIFPCDPSIHVSRPCSKDKKSVPIDRKPTPILPLPYSMLSRYLCSSEAGWLDIRNAGCPAPCV